nr:polysaccharide pyruvyl transferase family protein [uncultured Clostridium sp.]
MAKVGILSMQRIVNYGSFLQAYGLKMLLEKLGHNVEFVDYHIEKPLIAESRFQKQGVFLKVRKVLKAFQYDAPWKHRVQFVLYKKQFAGKYLPILGITPEMNYLPALDALVIGSDEVFNCIQSNPNVGYSLELFGKNQRAKKLLTYAASFGNTTIEKLKQYHKDQEISWYLKRFDAISVRDRNSGRIVSELSGVKPEYHLDPVLAYDYIGECRLIPQIKTKERYLILYAYSGRISREISDWILAYAKKKGVKIYSFGGIHRCGDYFIDCSPFDVLAFFQNAEAVITDTFHGTIFSMITKRKFVTIICKSRGNSYGNEEKLSDLLERTGLLDRVAGTINEIESVLESAIDYTAVDKIINAERVKTLDYLKKQIGCIS